MVQASADKKEWDAMIKERDSKMTPREFEKLGMLPILDGIKVNEELLSNV